MPVPKVPIKFTRKLYCLFVPYFLDISFSFFSIGDRGQIVIKSCISYGFSVPVTVPANVPVVKKTANLAVKSYFLLA